MKIFLAGGTGAIGKRLIPVLIKAGHQVVASTRSRDKSESLRAAGAQPVVVDGLGQGQSGPAGFWHFLERQGIRDSRASGHCKCWPRRYGLR